MEMSLYSFMYYINNNTHIVLLESLTGGFIGRFDRKNDIPSEWLGCKIENIFVRNNELVIEINVDGRR